MDDEYKPLYKNGPTQVGLVLAGTQIGSYRGDSRNLQLEGILSGETHTNLVFDELHSVNVPPAARMYQIDMEIDALKSLVRKESVAAIYQIK